MQVTTRIDDGRLQALIVPYQRAVLLEWCDRNGLVLKHGEVQSFHSVSTLFNCKSLQQ
jgi:hypothetical protein